MHFVIRRLGTFLILFLHLLPGAAQEVHYLEGDKQPRSILKDISIEEGWMADPGCSTSELNLQLLTHQEFKTIPDYDPEFNSCVITRVSLYNSATVPRRILLYFPKGWYQLDVFEGGNPISQIATIGTSKRLEYLIKELPPRTTTTVFVRYPRPIDAFINTYGVQVMDAAIVSEIQFRTILKYLLIGFLVFPLLYFLVVYVLERERIILAYLVFLLGAGLNLITMLDTIALFDLTPKALLTMPWGQRLFLLSATLCLGALIKYIQYMIEAKQQFRKLYQIGHILIALLSAVAIVPFIFPNLLHPETYGTYLRIFRPFALTQIIYILWLCIAAWKAKLKYSKAVALAFAPFLIAVFGYALSFILVGHYTSNDMESIGLISGFYLTTLLFGVILGMRNNEMKSAKIRLEEETANLRELDQFKSRFYTNFTHEFRTPLTVISGVTDQIEGHSHEKSLITRNSKRLLHTVNELLELSKLESNHLDIEWVQGDVIQFLNYLTESCTSLASDKHINLAFFSPQESITMDYDEQKLQQIIMNLLSNALKFTPEYGTVKVVCQASKEQLEIRISDTGAGIPHQDQPHIFDRFYQVEDHKYQGTGIGLSLVKELVQLLEGSITLKSEPERGSTFTVMLPIHHYAKEKATILPEIDLSDENSSKSEIKDIQALSDAPELLIIEDNYDVLEYIVSCLQGIGNIYTARDGKAGLNKAIELVPDLVISDVMMPEMDGYEVCNRIKNDIRTSHIPVMLLTAKATSKERIEGLKFGADAYLTKPFNKEELLIRCQNLFGWSKRLRNTVTLGNYAKVTEEKEAEFLKSLNKTILELMPDETFNTESLCREIGMSRTQLFRKLKALTGSSTANYIRKMRMDKAHELLQTTDLPVGDIAHDVGFRDFSHFSRTYARAFGHAPSQTRV